MRVNTRLTKDGICLEIKVRPKAGREGVTGVHDGALKVAVTAAPTRGKANKAVARLLARLLGVPAGSVSIIAGETSCRKKVLIKGIAECILLTRLREAAGLAGENA